MAKKEIPDIRDLVGKFGPVIQDLYQESDRAAVLIGAAYVDETLRSMFSSIFVAGRTTPALLHEEGPLGNYAVRVRLAYSMGFLGKKEVTKLLNIGEIRNKFAHGYERLSFASPEIVALCRTLVDDTYFDKKASEDGEAAAAKGNYIVAILVAVVTLYGFGMTTKRAEQSSPFEANSELWRQFRDAIANGVTAGSLSDKKTA